MTYSEKSEDYASRLAWTETAKTMPFGAIWDKFCEDEDVPLDTAWLQEVKTYEANVLSKRYSPQRRRGGVTPLLRHDHLCKSNQL